MFGIGMVTGVLEYKKVASYLQLLQVANAAIDQFRSQVIVLLEY